GQHLTIPRFEDIERQQRLGEQRGVRQGHHRNLSRYLHVPNVGEKTINSREGSTPRARIMGEMGADPMEAPESSPNIQAPSTRETSNMKPPSKISRLELGMLELLRCLELGCWSFNPALAKPPRNGACWPLYEK